LERRLGLTGKAFEIATVFYEAETGYGTNSKVLPLRFAFYFFVFDK
jgi:hypothetical protein